MPHAARSGRSDPWHALDDLPPLWSACFSPVFLDRGRSPASGRRRSEPIWRLYVEVQLGLLSLVAVPVTMPLSWDFTVHWLVSFAGAERRQPEQRRNSAGPGVELAALLDPTHRSAVYRPAEGGRRYARSAGGGVRDSAPASVKVRALGCTVGCMRSAYPRRPGPAHPSRSCPLLGRVRCVRAREATAQRLGLDSADSAEIIVQRGGRAPA